MLTKNQIKFITNLTQKKHRNTHQLFFVEGVKGVEELLQSNLILEHLYTTKSLSVKIPQEKQTIISESELKKISSLTTPNTCLAIFKMPKTHQLSTNGLILALDDVRDPGNLGTIIRLCDWYGIEHLLCSENTVDVYNPKVIQATMGSISRVNIVYTDLKKFIQTSDLPIFGTFLEGKNIYHSTLPKDGLIIMGNEANGISDEIKQIIPNKITIPRFGNKQSTESLNVATATAIVLSEFRRSI